MTAAWFVIAAAAGAIGRYSLGRLVCSWQTLLFANTAGAALLGWVLARDVDPRVVTVVGTGFCGALTTFSSFALEVRALGLRYGAVYVAATLIAVTSAASVASTL